MTPLIFLTGPVYAIRRSGTNGSGSDLISRSEHSDLTRSSWFSYQLGRLVAGNVDSAHASAVDGYTSSLSYLMMD
jgi:hypothetical protein